MHLSIQLNFIHRALIAGIGIAILAGPLGSLMLWRKMAYFGDTLAHATLLGLCLSFILNVNIYIGLIAVSLIVAFILLVLSNKSWSNDTILGILSHATLALGLICATTIKWIRLDLLSYLFGDILSVNVIDILCILSIDFLALIILWIFWQKFISVTIHTDLANVEGISVKLIDWLFIIMLSFVFAFAIKIIGVLLITALLIIPPAAARSFAKSPESMVFIASIIGITAVILGLLASLYLNWPTGPAIVVTATAIFFIVLFIEFIYD